MQPKKRPPFLPEFLSNHFSQDPVLLPLLGGTALLLFLCMIAGIFLSLNLFFSDRDLPPLSFENPTTTASSRMFVTPSPTSPPVVTETPSPTLIQTRTSSKPTSTQPIPSAAPVDFIRTYYTTINAGQYQTTWSMLSKNFKDHNHCCNPDGSYQFEPYANYWGSVAQVEILSIEIFQQDSSSASVSARLRYHYENQNIVDDNHVFILVKDELDERWQIDKVR